MAIGKNILANIVGRIWSIISVYVFVPIFIKLLGVECYGVIMFYTMMLTILTFADSGLTATLNREFAKDNNDTPEYKQNFLRTLEYTYIFIGIFVFVVIYILAPTIVTQFIKSNTIPFEDLVHYVRIMGVTSIFYLISSLYAGGLIGLQKQVMLNTLSVGYGVVRSGLVILPLIWIRSLELYFYWQLAATILYAIFLRYRLMNSVRVENMPICANFIYFKSVWKYAAGMMFMAIISAVNTQVDKMAIGNLLTLQDFTYYSLATMIGQGVLILAMPIGIAFFPELTRQMSIGDKDSYERFFHKFAYLIAAITSSIAVIVVCYAYDYVLIWTGNQSIADAIHTTVRILTFGGLFLSIQLCPYYLALANGHTRTNVTMGIAVVILIIPLFLFLIPKYGLIGAALPWLVVNFSATFLLGFIIIRKFMPEHFKRWFINDFIQPIVISFGVGVPLYLLFSMLPAGIYTVLYGVIIIIVALIVNGCLFIKRYPEFLENPVVSRLNIFKNE